MHTIFLPNLEFQRMGMSPYRNCCKSCNYGDMHIVFALRANQFTQRYQLWNKRHHEPYEKIMGDRERIFPLSKTETIDTRTAEVRLGGLLYNKCIVFHVCWLAHRVNRRGVPPCSQAFQQIWMVTWPCIWKGISEESRAIIDGAPLLVTLVFWPFVVFLRCFRVIMWRVGHVMKTLSFVLFWIRKVCFHFLRQNRLGRHTIRSMNPRKALKPLLVEVRCGSILFYPIFPSRRTPIGEFTISVWAFTTDYCFKMTDLCDFTGWFRTLKRQRHFFPHE